MLPAVPDQGWKKPRNHQPQPLGQFFRRLDPGGRLFPVGPAGGAGPTEVHPAPLHLKPAKACAPCFGAPLPAGASGPATVKAVSPKFFSVHGNHAPAYVPRPRPPRLGQVASKPPLLRARTRAKNRSPASLMIAPHPFPPQRAPPEMITRPSRQRDAPPIYFRRRFRAGAKHVLVRALFSSLPS